MELKFKDYLYITCLSSFPFLSLLLTIKTINTNYPKIYDTLIILMLLVFIISFIITIIYTIEHIRYNNYKKNIIIKIILTIIFNIFYLPIYYTKYILKSDLYIGVILLLLNIGSVYSLYYDMNSYFKDYFDNKNIIIINTEVEKEFLNNELVINLNTNYTCDSSINADSVLECSNNKDNSNLVIYEYNLDSYKKNDIKKAYKYQVKYIENSLKDNLVNYSESTYLDTLIINCDSIKEPIYVTVEKGKIIRTEPIYDENNNVIDYKVTEEILYSDPIIDGYNDLSIENVFYIKRVDILDHALFVVMEFQDNNSENYFKFLELIDGIQINYINS